MPISLCHWESCPLVRLALPLLAPLQETRPLPKYNFPLVALSWPQTGIAHSVLCEQVLQEGTNWNHVYNLPSVLHMSLLHSRHGRRLYLAPRTVIPEATVPFLLCCFSLLVVNLGGFAQKEGGFRAPVYHLALDA